MRHEVAAKFEPLLLKVERVDEGTVTHRQEGGELVRRAYLRASLSGVAPWDAPQNMIFVDLPVGTPVTIGQLFELKPAAS